MPLLSPIPASWAPEAESQSYRLGYLSPTPDATQNPFLEQWRFAEMTIQPFLIPKYRGFLSLAGITLPMKNGKGTQIQFLTPLFFEVWPSTNNFTKLIFKSLI